jgi:hypothetical protein
MERLFHNTVSALCYDLARAHGEEYLPANEAVRFVLRQHPRMPRYLGWGIRAATLLLATSGLLYGSLYHRLTPERRGRIVRAWKQSALQPFRDLMRFYESLVVMAIYSRPPEERE